MTSIENQEKFQIVEVIIPKKLPQGTRIFDVFDNIKYYDMHGSEGALRGRVVRNSFLELFVPYDDNGVRQGRWIVNSSQLMQFAEACEEINIHVLNLGSLRLEKSQFIYNLKTHAVIENIYAEVLEDALFICNPGWQGWQNTGIHTG